MCWCPFHNDKYPGGNPSFEVKLGGEHCGEYYCYSCGMAGRISQAILDKIMSKKKKSKTSDSTKPTPINWEGLNIEYGVAYFYEVNTLNPDVPFNVSRITLNHLNCGWDGKKAFTFPMRNGKNEIIGIQRQYPDRTKKNVDGSSNGLFIPQIRFDPGIPVYICEGCSDTATVLDLGFQSIGRPNSSYGNDFVVEWIELNSIHSVYIVADNDETGIKGAKGLASDLGCMKPEIIIPQCKDVREMVEKIGNETTIKLLETNR